MAPYYERPGGLVNGASVLCSAPCQEGFFVETYRIHRSDEQAPRLRVSQRGRALLTHPMLNKGTAFSQEERAALGLEGLLPSSVFDIEEQARRSYAHLVRKESALERYIGLAALQDRNETLYYRILCDHLEELLPIVYTPTVGEACQRFSHIFRRGGRGLWITPEHRGRIHEVLGNAPFEDVRLIVVTDNERILGLGDQGAGGMGIPIGKLALYTAAAGIHPAQTLPISLDVGTDNRSLLDDELYVGWRAPRLRGEAYHSLVDEFVHAVRKRFPRALLQWEDFKKQNAFDLLDRYRETLPSFNDDIEGTAAVALAGVLAACRAVGRPFVEQRVVILGAGAAGIGIGRQLRAAFRRGGLEGDALTRAVAVLDSRGLLVAGRGRGEVYKREFEWPEALVRESGLPSDGTLDLPTVVDALAPTVLIGTSGEPGAFPEAVVRAMAARTPRPVIFPFSNPTANSEATPADLIAWTDGRALIATGSPFDPVVHAGTTIRTGQGNNAFIFPGVGLGALVAEVRTLDDTMFTAAAEALANLVEVADLEAGSLFPPLRQLRSVTARVAEAVVRKAVETGAATRKLSDAEIPSAVAQAKWEPTYPVYEPA